MSADTSGTTGTTGTTAVRPRSALVIGTDTQAFLGVVRSLGRCGVAVHVVPFDCASVALSSRYIRSVHRLPPLSLDPEGWVAALVNLCASLQPDVIVPCDDRSIVPLQAYWQRIAHLRVGLPGTLGFDAFFDKGATRELALACGVPVPPGRVLAAGDTAEQLVAEFGLPLFIKPRSSYLLRALAQRREVKACHSVTAVRLALAGMERVNEYLVEACFPGVGVGVSVLARDGVVSQAFQHRRLREPVRGGGSSYRVSEALSPDLEAMTLALCRASRLDGVAMFEYKVDDATGCKALLEVNARFWGSLPLAIAAGVDFPHLWFRQALGDEPAPRVPYRVPHYARNLLSDLYAMRGHVALRRGEGWRVMALARLRWVASLGRLLGGLETLDTLVRDDPRPGWLELRAIGVKLVERVERHLPGRRERRQRELQRCVADAWREAAQARRPVQVVVACWGNICRSPYAAVRAARLLGGGPVPVHVTGAGLAGQPGRPAPERAVAAAARAGVDLSAHRSRCADDALLEQADLLLVFDHANLDLLASRGPTLRRPAIRLREFLGPAAGNGNIDDPVDGDDAFFDHTYRLIDHALLELQRTVVLL
jgi:protein-tyrosine-phosphatase/predicted ATP-grasp superfamily ATP-dependent carboligase